MCKHCKIKIIEFIDISLDGDVNKLRKFDFTELGILFQRDCDRLRIITAIYCLIYSERFNLTTCLLKTEIFNNNSGDTINTYHSSFGNGPAGKRAQKMIDEAGDLGINQMLNIFKKRYHSIGNFMPLPKKTIQRGVSINTARNTAANDYFDLFLKIVEDYYNIKKSDFLKKYAAKNQRKGIQNLSLVMVENSAYFGLFQDYCTFISWNHLGAFYKKDRFPLFKHTLEDIHFKSIEDISSYLTNTIAIIEERSNSLVDALKPLLR